MYRDHPTAATSWRVIWYALVALLVAPLAHAELLFQDDFSSGDFSKHNDFFRWGRDGSIPNAGNTFGGILERIDGPRGATVTAIRLRYGTWQEVRFHLTRSVSEIRTESGASSTAYPETWFGYWLWVPSNYAHGQADPDNNKGFVTVWKDAYLANSAQWAVDWIRVGTHDSQMRAWMLDRNTGYNWPIAIGTGYGFVNVRQDHRIAGSPTQAYAFVPNSDYGRWMHIAVGWKMATSAGAKDGYFRYYQDGQLVAERVNADNYLPPPLNGVDRGYIFGYHNAAYTEPTTFYVTDFKFGTSQADVMPTNVSPPRPPTSLSVQ